MKHAHSAKKSDEIKLNVWFLSPALWRRNPWIVSTLILLIALVLVLVFGSPFGGQTRAVSADEAGQKVITFIQSNPELQGEVTYVGAVREGYFYKVTVHYQGTDVPVYTTLDGKFLLGNPVPLP